MTVLPAEASRPWAELPVRPGLSNLPTRPGLFVGRASELARLDAALAGPGGGGGAGGVRPGRDRQEHPGRALGRRPRQRLHPDLVDHRHHTRLDRRGPPAPALSARWPVAGRRPVAGVGPDAQLVQVPALLE